MTRNAVAITSAVLFVVLALSLMVAPVPFVVWNPGKSYNVLANDSQGKPLIKVQGPETYPVTGELLMTTVSSTTVDSSVNLAEALFAHWRYTSDAMPREAIYPSGRSNEEVQREAIQQMDTSQRDAAVAALRAGGQQITEMVQVVGVTKSGPSHELLQVGDFISSVDGTQVTTAQDVQAAVRKHAVGEVTKIEVLRQDVVEEIPITTVSSNTDKSIPTIGVMIKEGYQFNADISYGLDPKIVGPSAGLVFALAIYDQITKADLMAGRKIAGTGGISASGQVQMIGGIREKIASAQSAGAEVFLVPSENCPDVVGLETDLELVKVATLKDAIAALQLLNEAKPTSEVPRCG